MSLTMVIPLLGDRTMGDFNFILNNNECLNNKFKIHFK